MMRAVATVAAAALLGGGAAAWAEAGAGTAPAPGAETGPDQVRALWHAGALAEARARADALAAAAPADPALLVLAGDAARAAGDPAAAAARYGRALGLSGKVGADRKAPPVFADAANAIARLRLEADDGPGAEKILAFAYLHYPGDRATLTNLALAAALRREWDRAAAFLARATAAPGGDLLAAELARELERLRTLTGVEPPARVTVEPFATDGSTGHRAGWGLVVAALVRRALASPPVAPPSPRAPLPSLVVTGNVADRDTELVVTAHVLVLPKREEAATFTIRIAGADALPAELGRLVPRLAAVVPAP
jgi:hypothetical protein